MSLLALIIALVVVGIVMYAINVYVPMADNIKKLLNVVVILFLIIWLMQAFGLFTYVSRIRIGTP